MGTSIARVTPLSHMLNRLRQLEQMTHGVVCAQFAVHPEGLSYVVRIYLPQAEKEYTYPDVILPSECCNEAEQNSRIDVLFDMIHTALESVQVVTSTNNGLIIH